VLVIWQIEEEGKRKTYGVQWGNRLGK